MQSLLIILFGSLILGLLSEALLLSKLKQIKAGQTIRVDGPQAHLAKAGTPTMGGLAIIFTVVVFDLIYIVFNSSLGAESRIPVIGLVMICYGAVGFYDDYLKIVRHDNEALSPSKKMLLLLIVSVIYAIYEYKQSSLVYIPFVKINVDFGIWIIPFIVFVMIAMTNSVNLSDGLDGLCGSMTVIVSLLLALCFGKLAGKSELADSINYEGFVVALALAGATLGFLGFNKHPASVFMGDTGSLAIGGALAAIAISFNIELILPIAGIVFVFEAVSVIIQVFVFKTQNGRRFFRMAPIHHHFELGGWSEVKVVTVFCFVTFVFCVIAYGGI